MPTFPTFSELTPLGEFDATLRASGLEVTNMHTDDYGYVCIVARDGEAATGTGVDFWQAVNDAIDGLAAQYAAQREAASHRCDVLCGPIDCKELCSMPPEQALAEAAGPGQRARIVAGLEQLRLEGQS